VYNVQNTLTVTSCNFLQTAAYCDANFT